MFWSETIGKNRKRLNTGISGLSFSWKRALSVSRTRQRIAWKTSITTTKAGISLPIEKYQELLDGFYALGDVMGSDKVVAKIQKNNAQENWIGFNTYKGIPLIYLRTFSAFGDSPEFRPTKQGVSLKVEQYPYLLDSVQKLGEKISSV
jgi:hypothetical protein